jgi:hypothetical protein
MSSVRGAFALVCIIALATAALAAGASAAPFAQPLAGKLHLRKRALAVARSGARPRWACPEGACEAIVAPTPVPTPHGFALPLAQRALEGSGELGGYDPADLQSAYRIPSSGGSGQTIALVDAFGYPRAESDLAKYRSRYGLPPCTEADGCFEKVNERGERGNYPAEEPGWDEEAALDEDMVSAACPQCHILLVEGSSELPADLGQAVNTAVRLGATEVSNSYGYPEKLKELCGSDHCRQFAEDYNHPGVPIFASAGDSGFEDTYFDIGLQTNFPASAPTVVAVGGTALRKDASSPRSWHEQVWNEPEIEAGTGSGCSKFEAKPTWQSNAGCAHRTDNDLAADAAVETGVSVRIDGHWEVFGGTSVASPLVAGIEAHASAAERAQGAAFFYAHPSSLFDVTEGFNWNPASGTSECAAEEYLCNAQVGYDGPTGLGTPDGVVEVAPEPPTVTGVSPKRGPVAGGTEVTITGANFTGATAVSFGSTAAREFTVRSATSISAQSPPGAVGTVDVTVTNAAGTSPVTKADSFRYTRAKR